MIETPINNGIIKSEVVKARVFKRRHDFQSDSL